MQLFFYTLITCESIPPTAPPCSVFGAPSAPNGDIAMLMANGYAKKLHDGAEDPAYCPFAVGRPKTSGGAPPPRPNLTSALRTQIAQRRQSLEPRHPAHRPRHRERALPRPGGPESPDWATVSGPVAKGELLASRRIQSQSTEQLRGGSNWKLGRFTEVRAYL